MKGLIVIFLMTNLGITHAQTVEKMESNGGVYFSSGFYNDTLTIYLNDTRIVDSSLLKTTANLGCVPLALSFFYSEKELYIQNYSDVIYKVSTRKRKTNSLKVQINGVAITLDIQKNKYYTIKKKDLDFKVEESTIEPSFN